MIYNQTKYNNNWKTMKLNQLGTFARGKSKHRPRNDKKLFEGGGYPLVQTGEIKEANLYVNKHKVEYNEFGLSQSKLWDKDTLCITIAANIAETAILGYPMCFPDSIVGFNANKEICSELFMHYIFTYIRQAIQKSASGSIQDNINIDYLEQLDFKIPDKKIQDKICNVLYNIDIQIENNNRIIESLENISKTIYDYWFLQYEFPNEEEKTYKSSGGKMVYNEELKKEIPEGWDIKRISDIEKNIVTGKTPSTKDEGNFGGDIPFITIDDIRQGLYISKTIRTLSEKGANLQIKKYIPKNSICVTCIATVGLVGITTKDSQTNQQINSIICQNKNNLYYLVNAIKNYFEYSNGAKSGNIFDNMNKEDFSSIKLIYPTEDILKIFNEKVEPIYRKIKSCIFENEELAKLRDYLLPLLMNGQVGFKD